MVRPATVEAYRLIHEGALALADMEEAGVYVNRDVLAAQTAAVQARIKALDQKLREHPVFDHWRRAFGEKVNLDSRPQLAHVLFKVMGIPCDAFTEKTEDLEDEDLRRPSTKVDALEKIELGFVKGYLKRAKLAKLVGTYLQGIAREVAKDGFVRAFFNLHTVTTVRSSGTDPNLQNVPIRDPEIGQIIRSVFYPRGEDWQLMEIDFTAIEVCSNTWYHKDPTMLRYIAEGYDMHRDMAAECYLLPADAIPKPVRQEAKGKFVFAEFYGDWYLSCAEALWETIGRQKLTTKEGLGLYDHLAAKGITCLGNLDSGSADRQPPGSFVTHIKAVEDRFWNKRFRVYGQWRRDWYAAYQNNGGFNTLTGFSFSGQYSRNFVINCPGQGTAFHCLLWSIIRINNELKARRMRSKLIMQIHDSLIGDVAPGERDDFIEICTRVMTQELRAAWTWIITPLKVEIEAADVGGPWSTKKKIA